MTKNFNVFLLLFSICTAGYAQNQFKNPTRFKLKNDFTVIIAQNVGAGKIYARITLENEVLPKEKLAADVIGEYLASKAGQFNLRQSTESKVTSQVSMTYNEANIATSLLVFEQALSFVAENLLDPELPRLAFSTIQNLSEENRARLKILKISDLQSFHVKHFKPSAVFITIAGDISPSEAKLISSRVFVNRNSKLDSIAE